jgi:hypothetical protein
MATFEEEVNEIVANSTVDEEGNLQLPEGTEANEQVIYAAKLEKRHRDTQSSYTKSQQRNKQLEAENSKLAESWEVDAIESLTSSQKSKLEELKSQDPDAYVKKISEIRDEAKVTFKEKREKLTKEVSDLSELEVRQAELDAYNAYNPKAQITQESIDNDVPPRVVKQLKEGKITFTEFLETAKKYLTTGKAVKKGEKIEDEPDLNKSSGSDSPSGEALKNQSSKDYTKEIY